MDGGASAHAFIQQGLAASSEPLSIEVTQGLEQLEQLLVAHHQQNLIVPSLWVEAVVDAGEPLLSHDERVAAVLAMMEATVGVFPRGSQVSSSGL